jgi:hypothetical protein
LASIERNGRRTSLGYKTCIAYSQDFRSKYYHQSAENIINELHDKKNDIYSLINEFIDVSQTKKVNPSSIKQCLEGVRSFLEILQNDDRIPIEVSTTGESVAGNNKEEHGN